VLHVSRFSASLLRTSARAYARAALHALHESRRDLVETDLPRTFAAPAGDIEVRLLQLAGSLAVDRPVLFADALAWYKVAFHHRGVPADYLPATLGAIETTLGQELPAEVFAHVRQHLAAAAHELPRAPVAITDPTTATVLTIAPTTPTTARITPITGPTAGTTGARSFHSGLDRSALESGDALPYTLT
jgi:hypothetical protein